MVSNESLSGRAALPSPRAQLMERQWANYLDSADAGAEGSSSTSSLSFSSSNFNSSRRSGLTETHSLMANFKSQHKQRGRPTKKQDTMNKRDFDSCAKYDVIWAALYEFTCVCYSNGILVPTKLGQVRISGRGISMKFHGAKSQNWSHDATT